MVTTTSYGTFLNHVGSCTVEDCVTDALGPEGLPEATADRIVWAYRDAIDTALPESVSLCGNEFYGPAYPCDQDFDGYPTTEYGMPDIAAIIGDIDFWGIVDDAMLDERVIAALDTDGGWEVAAALNNELALACPDWDGGPRRWVGEFGEVTVARWDGGDGPEIVDRVLTSYGM